MRDNIVEKYTSNVYSCATMFDNIADEHWCNNIAGLKNGMGDMEQRSRRMEMLRLRRQSRKAIKSQHVHNVDVDTALVFL